MGTPEIEEAKRRLAELAMTPEEDWNAKVDLLKETTILIGSGDVEAQRFIVSQVERAGSSWTADVMATALLGDAGGNPVDLVKQLGMKPATSEVIRELVRFLPTATGGVLRAAIRAVLQADRERAVGLFTPFLDPGPTPDAVARERMYQILFWAANEPPLRPLFELAVRTAVRIHDQGIVMHPVPLWNATPEWDPEIAHLLELDVPPERVHFYVRLALTGGYAKIDARRRKRLLPHFQAAAARVRDDPSARPRLEEAEKALELPGSLLSTKKVKLPKPPARIALKHGAGTEGGPVIALPVEVVQDWRGAYLPDGKPGEGDFAGTDYGRACSVKAARSPWGTYGFIDVGKLGGLVIGLQGCQFAKLEDGTCLLVMESEAAEDVAALLKEQRAWKKLAGTLELPSGQLVLFDSAYARASKHKTVVKLAPGTYTVDEYDEDGDRTLWVVRLTPVGKASSAGPPRVR